MCGSAPAPLAAQPSLPSTVGAAGGGGTLPTPTTTPTTASTSLIAAPAAATTAATTTAGGPPQKLPTSGGGPADGAANLQLQTALSSLVQALTALTELLKKQPATAVAGANGTGGGGPAPKGGGDTPPAKGGGEVTQAPMKVPTQGGGPAGCDTPPPALTPGTMPTGMPMPHA
ncbi:MAG: hypothetical protein JWM98_1504 [Thermoleophilia bacterium]|nr:hypothetical protein [Thermoleophilia bacterium]